MDTIQKRGRLRVGTKFDQPLFGLKNPVTGDVEGFDVDIAKLMAVGIFGGDTDSVKDKVEFVETVSKNREPFIQEGKVDIVVATYTINDTRKQQVDFAGPYLVANQDIMVRQDDTAIKTVADLNGKKVCSATGSTSIKNIQAKAPKADLSISFDKYSLCAEALADRRVDAVTTDDAILAGLVNDNPGKFKLLGADLSDEPYGIGLKKGDDAFRNFLNDRLEEIFESGEWAEAFQATVGKVITATPEPPQVDRYASAGAGGSSTTSSSTTSTTKA
jgi:glutamate transport system substrate-binding protein